MENRMLQELELARKEPITGKTIGLIILSCVAFATVAATIYMLMYLLP